MKSPKRRSPKRRSPKRMSPKRRSPKRRSPKRRSPKKSVKNPRKRSICWKGYHRVKGTSPYSKGSCAKN